MLIATALFAVLTAAQAAPAAAPPPAAAAPAERPQGFDLAKLKLDQCAGERFDFTAAAGGKVSLCSNAGASKDEIAAMLDSAVRQLEGSTRVRVEVRNEILAQIRAKAAEVRAR